MISTVKKSAIYDLAKVITTLLVVLAHAARMYTDYGVYTPVVSSEIMTGIHDFIYAFHMPFFVFLSGCVYGFCIEHGKYRDIPGFIQGKAKKLLIPYTVFGIAYVAPVMVLLGLSQWNYFEYIISGIVVSLNARHLWYILALFFIFLMAIPMEKIPFSGIRKHIAMMMISIGLFVVSRFMPDHFQIRSTLIYQLYFFIGVVFNDLYERLEKVSDGLKIALLCASALVMMSMFWLELNFIMQLAQCFAGIAMMVVLVWTMLRLFPGIVETPIYKLIKKNSFGIYLFHPMIIYVLFSKLHTLEVIPAVLVFAVTFISITLSVWATNIVRKLHLQIVIGE